MKSLRMPIEFSNGRIATLSDTSKIVKQKIIDVLVTSARERVMNPNYGAGAYSLLYDTLDPLVFADFKQEAISDLNKNVSNARILDIIVQPKDSVYIGETDTSLEVNVVYQIPPHQQATMSFTVSEFANEESFIY